MSWMSSNFVRFHEIQFQTDSESFSLPSWKTKKKVLFRNKYSLSRFFQNMPRSVQKMALAVLNFQWGFWYGVIMQQWRHCVCGGNGSVCELGESRLYPPHDNFMIKCLIYEPLNDNCLTKSKRTSYSSIDRCCKACYKVFFIVLKHYALLPQKITSATAVLCQIIYATELLLSAALLPRALFILCLWFIAKYLNHFYTFLQNVVNFDRTVWDYCTHVQNRKPSCFQKSH